MNFFFVACQTFEEKLLYDLFNEQWVVVVVVVFLEAQSCPTLCDPMDCNPPASSVHGILQARILEWVATPSRRSSRPRDQTQVSCIAGDFCTV